MNTMYNHLNDIIIGLKGLGNMIGQAELNRKLLLSLPKESPKVTMIEEAKDIASMTKNLQDLSSFISTLCKQTRRKM